MSSRDNSHDGADDKTHQLGSFDTSLSSDANQLQRLLLASQQIQPQSSDGSSSLMALLIQQQQMQSPQMMALLQRQQQEQFLALQLTQLQQQQQQRQPHLDGLFSGLVGSPMTSSLDVMLAQQQLLKQLGASTTLGSHFLNGPTDSAAATLSASTHSTEKPDEMPKTLSLSSTDDNSSKLAAAREGRSAAATASEADEEDETGESDEDAHDTFPFKLYRMLMEAEKDGKDGIVSFNKSGKSFSIHKPRLFVAEIMPKYFTTSRMSSFQRQLNLYGFRRIAEGPDKGSYWHRDFLRGRKSLCKNIRRKKPGLKLSTSTYGYFVDAAVNGAAAVNSQALSVRQMIADGQLSAEQRILAVTQQTNPALAAALLMEKQRQQAEMFNQLVLRQEQERELERQLLEQSRENQHNNNNNR